jgi:5'-nucleotidase
LQIFQGCGRFDTTASLSNLAVNKRLIVDMDGVLADIYSQLFDFEQRDTGRRKSTAEVTGISESQAFPGLEAYLHTPGFFRGAPVIPESREILEKLNAHYDVFIVSAATEFPLSLAEKQAWLREHFPYISWQQLVLCGSKRIVQGDIMIDDHFKNLDAFEGRTLLFTQPHNQQADNRGHERVDTWSQISSLLL